LVTGRVRETGGGIAPGDQLSRQAINAIERGKFDPSLPLAFKLAELFNLPIEEIFMWVDSTGEKS